MTASAYRPTPARPDHVPAPSSSPGSSRVRRLLLAAAHVAVVGPTLVRFPADRCAAGIPAAVLQWAGEERRGSLAGEKQCRAVGRVSCILSLADCVYVLSVACLCPGAMIFCPGCGHDTCGVWDACCPSVGFPAVVAAPPLVCAQPHQLRRGAVSRPAGSVHLLLLPARRL